MTTSKKVVLHIDDDITLKLMLHTYLTKHDFRVVGAEDGKSGLKIALEEHPDLILLDYTMPYLNGIEVLTKLRKDPWGARVPVIFFTNIYDLQVVNSAMQLGVKSYVMKSDMSLSTVLELVKKYTGIIHSRA